MAYIWQDQSWPNSTWDAAKLLPFLSSTLRMEAAFVEKMKGLGKKGEELTEESLLHWQSIICEGRNDNRGRWRTEPVYVILLPDVAEPRLDHNRRLVHKVDCRDHVQTVHDAGR